MSINQIFEEVINFKLEMVASLVEKEIQKGSDINDVLNNGLISAMDEVGKRFSAGDLFVPEMLMAAQAMKAGLAVLKPHLATDTSYSKGTVVIGTVKGDLHDIGKNLVAMMMEGAGLTIVDLGVDVDEEKFVAAVNENNADVVALSALLTTTMPAMESTIKAVREAGLDAKIIIGGAPVTQNFADQIEADGYGTDAPKAVELVRKLIGR